MSPQESLIVLMGLPGLLNPFSLLVGAVLGWYADSRKKLIIVGFAAAVLSVLLDAAMNVSGVAPVGGYDGGPLAVFPFRFAGAALIGGLVHGMRKRIKGEG